MPIVDPLRKDEHMVVDVQVETIIDAQESGVSQVRIRPESKDS